MNESLIDVSTKIDTGTDNMSKSLSITKSIDSALTALKNLTDQEMSQIHGALESLNITVDTKTNELSNQIKKETNEIDNSMKASTNILNNHIEEITTKVNIETNQTKKLLDALSETLSATVNGKNQISSLLTTQHMTLMTEMTNINESLIEVSTKIDTGTEKTNRSLSITKSIDSALTALKNLTNHEMSQIHGALESLNITVNLRTNELS